jgi:hypothetical protein
MLAPPCSVLTASMTCWWAACESRLRQHCKITIFSLAIAIMNSACYADNNRVWAEQFVGRASTNWDLRHGSTEITDIYLQVIGPSDLANEAVTAAEACASISLKAAYQKYYYAPGDPAAKLAQAYGVFKSLFWGCVSLTSIAGAVFEKFNIGITRKKRWENGIFATGVLENPNAALVDKYIIQNAPKESRGFLNLTNRILNRPWLAPIDQSSPIRNLPVPGLMLGIFPPTPPIIKVFREFSDHLPNINAPKVDLSKIKL